MPMSELSKKSVPLATALRQALAQGYSIKTFRADLLAAFIVSLVALPLGGSMTQVGGPTAAFVVVVAPIVAELGLRGIIITEIRAGFMLVPLARARFGRFISFVPYPVTTGFTAGIAVVLATLSLN